MVDPAQIMADAYRRHGGIHDADGLCCERVRLDALLEAGLYLIQSGEAVVDGVVKTIGWDYVGVPGADLVRKVPYFRAKEIHEA